eukprot:TRINITY_DN34274_c0_g1_i1.p1 TRINITY_DN34274_c0_g1~~TRINITY_DN34274_c0_g1_i1.p1  ORF type:complete len:281 (+),score=59.12 TRINITY_DN34274_c0_g1_i1:122-964(+)
MTKSKYQTNKAARKSRHGFKAGHKHHWSREEDDVVRQWVDVLGIDHWNEVAEHIPGHTRTAKQVRERWYQHLRPDVVRRPWTKHEDTILIERQRKLGNRWLEISRFLPGRPSNAIKNRWGVVLRRRAAKSEEDSGDEAHEPLSQSRPHRTTAQQKIYHDDDEFMSDTNNEGDEENEDDELSERSEEESEGVPSSPSKSTHSENLSPSFFSFDLDAQDPYFISESPEGSDEGACDLQEVSFSFPPEPSTSPELAMLASYLSGELIPSVGLDMDFLERTLVA